jgi:alpha-L-fucosidase
MKSNVFLGLLALSGAIAFGQSGPGATPETVAQAIAKVREPAKGPVEQTWDSIRAHYKTPAWWIDAKFGIMMHWGLYAVPAHGSEWYALHMYNNPAIAKWHQEKWGPQDKFGYKDFIPLFTATKFDPDAWARLFKEAGAKFVVPTAEHHDGFALWDTTHNKYNAKNMGPRRDLIADLGAAVRRQGLKFGVSDHSIEHFTFIRDAAAPKNDLREPQWADFYAVADRDKPEALQKFLTTWTAKQLELIDKYQPDILWFDNGVNSRTLDPLKLRIAAHYYNRALEWKKDVSISTKGHGTDHEAFLAGTIADYERMSRAPAELTDYHWQVDEPVLYRFGYTENNPTPIAKAGSIITSLVNNVSKNGALLLNISPKADGTIPDDQQALLQEIGAWMKVNGEAIYGTRPWKNFGEGKLKIERGAHYTAADLRFTTKPALSEAEGGDALYVFTFFWPESGKLIVTSVSSQPMHVELLGVGPVPFRADTAGLNVTLPPTKPAHLQHAYVLKITGANLR